MAVYAPEFIAKVRRFMEIRERRDEDAARAKASEKEYRELEAEVWEDLAPDAEAEDQKLHGHKIPLGSPWGTVTFEPRETIYGRIIDQEAAQDHYEQRAMIDEIVVPKFAMARINEEVRAAHEAGGSLPPGTDFYAKRFVAIRRPKS